MEAKKQISSSNEPKKLKPSEIIKKVLGKAGRPFFEPIKTLALASGATTTISFTNQDNLSFLITEVIAHAELASAVGTPIYNYTIKLKDSGRSQSLMDVAMHGSALGNREYPTILEIPYLVRNSGQFQAEITNLAGANINVYLTFKGYKIENIANMDGKGTSSVDILKSILMKAGSLYFQSVSVTSLAAGTLVRLPFTNQDNIPFIISKIVGYAVNASGLAQTFNYTLSFKDSGQIKLWMNTPIYGTAIGSGNRPMLLEAPYPLLGNSTFETEIANIDGAIAENVYVSFIGYKIDAIKI